MKLYKAVLKHLPNNLLQGALQVFLGVNGDTNSPEGHP